MYFTIQNGVIHKYHLIINTHAQNGKAFPHHLCLAVLTHSLTYLFHSPLYRKKKMLTNSKRLSILAWAKDTHCSTILTMASCYTPITSSLLWASSSPTLPITRSCVLSAKYMEKTLITVRKTVIRDVLTSKSRSNHDHSYENSAFTLPISKRNNLDR